MTDTVVVGSEPGPLNFVTRHGDKIGPVELQWPDGTDLSDRNWAAQARGDRDGDTTIVADWTVDDSEAATGKLVIWLPASECRKLVTPHPEPGFPEVPGEGVYPWDLQGTKKTDVEDVHTWVAGDIAVSGDTTVVADA